MFSTTEILLNSESDQKHRKRGHHWVYSLRHNTMKGVGARNTSNINTNNGKREDLFFLKGVMEEFCPNENKSEFYLHNKAKKEKTTITSVEALKLKRKFHNLQKKHKYSDEEKKIIAPEATLSAFLDFLERRKKERVLTPSQVFIPSTEQPKVKKKKTNATSVKKLQVQPRLSSGYARELYLATVAKRKELAKEGRNHQQLVSHKRKAESSSPVEEQNQVQIQTQALTPVDEQPKVKKPRIQFAAHNSLLNLFTLPVLSPSEQEALRKKNEDELISLIMSDIPSIKKTS